MRTEIAALQRKSSGPKPKAKPRGRPWPKGVSGNPSGKRKGCVSLVATLKRLFSRADAESVVRRLVALAQGGDTQAMKLIFDRLDGPQNGPLALTMSQAMSVSQENHNDLQALMAAVPTASLIARIQRDFEELGETAPPLIEAGRGSESVAQTAPPPLPQPRQPERTAEPQPEPEPDPPPRGVLTATEFLK